LFSRYECLFFLGALAVPIYPPRVGPRAGSPFTFPRPCSFPKRVFPHYRLAVDSFRSERPATVPMRLPTVPFPFDPLIGFLNLQCSIFFLQTWPIGTFLTESFPPLSGCLSYFLPGLSFSFRPLPMFILTTSSLLPWGFPFPFVWGICCLLFTAYGALFPRPRSILMSIQPFPSPTSTVRCDEFFPFF